jgi:hypothetical protein
LQSWETGTWLQTIMDSIRYVPNFAIFAKVGKLKANQRTEVLIVVIWPIDDAHCIKNRLLNASARLYYSVESAGKLSNQLKELFIRIYRVKQLLDKLLGKLPGFTV